MSMISAEKVECPRCDWVIETSEEDPDASLSCAVDHVRSKHGLDTEAALAAIHGLDENRESWLIRSVAELSGLLAGHTMPPVKVSVGWPGGSGKKATVVGQCWPTTASEDGIAQIFMSPVRGKAETQDVLGTLLHEMIHALDDCKSGHRGNFAKIAKSVGFLPKLTSASNRDDTLNEALEEIADKVGPFPHAAIVLGARGSEEPKKQGTRMLKVSCSNGSGFIVRMTQKWIVDVGLPLCACCQVPMKLEEAK